MSHSSRGPHENRSCTRWGGSRLSLEWFFRYAFLAGYIPSDLPAGGEQEQGVRDLLPAS